MEIKNIRAIHDREYIYELIAEGEHENQDFKFQISDSRKIARSIAAFANNNGGHLLIGVKDNGVIAGIRSEEEYYMIEQASELYCRPAQSVEQTLYNIDGKMILKVDIKKTQGYPVEAQDDNRQWQIYYRVVDENIQAPDLFVKIWKAKNESEGVLLNFTERESKMLAFISNKKIVTIEELSIIFHQSIDNTEISIARLCAMEVLKPIYANGKWGVAVSEPEPFP